MRDHVIPVEGQLAFGAHAHLGVGGIGDAGLAVSANARRQGSPQRDAAIAHRAARETQFAFGFGQWYGGALDTDAVFKNFEDGFFAGFCTVNCEPVSAEAGEAPA